MSSSYFPYQLPPHVLQLSIQYMNITKPFDPPSTPQGESSSASYKWKSSPKAPDPRAKAALEATIRSNFKSNISEHQAAYMKGYAGNEVISNAELIER